MIGKASVITHGANAVRYSADKDMAEIVKGRHRPKCHVGTHDAPPEIL